ncbi:MAG: Asp-tRNA(Asn)/Glu-tRNA(Gln) amidotransferase GatCAB subunit A [Dethiosulfovibrio peptidovorans]|nr:MAG: Asp-tRNA(Asn)/Glu-tRNA(Gln) amidotransferase GatCAB subunit A [Dethiosulfovibrio peptidovorans]
MDLFRLSAVEMAQGVRDGKFSALDVTRSCLDRIDAMEPRIHAMLLVLREEAERRARSLDDRRAGGEDLGSLGGVPVILKDNMCTAGVATTCGSSILDGWLPPYDATVVRLLHQAGAVILGKANMDEFAMGGSTENSAYGVTRNPWDIDRVPGGSSGGSAAAVSAGYAPLALGSDTGGSIRQPASFCGTYGLKPTYGRVSRYGLVAFASSLDQIGPFARTAQDLALVMETLGEHDPLDSTSAVRDRDLYGETLARKDLKGKSVGVIREIEGYDYDESVRRAFQETVSACEEAGARIVPISLTTAIEYGMACYYILAPAEASSNLARYDGVRYGRSAAQAESIMDLYLTTRKEGFGTEVKRRILTGTYVLSAGFYDAYYLKAQKVRQVIRREFAQAFSRVDSIVLPVSPTPAFTVGELIDDPLAMYMADVFTLPVNMAGLPGLSMNVGYTDGGLPLGVQLIGPRWGETEIVGMASVLERRFGEASIAEGGVSR